MPTPHVPTLDELEARYQHEREAAQADYAEALATNDAEAIADAAGWASRTEFRSFEDWLATSTISYRWVADEDPIDLRWRKLDADILAWWAGVQAATEELVAGQGQDGPMAVAIREWL